MYNTLSMIMSNYYQKSTFDADNLRYLLKYVWVIFTFILLWHFYFGNFYSSV